MRGFSDAIRWARQKLNLGPDGDDQDIGSQPWPNPASSAGEVVDYIFDNKRQIVRFTCWETVGPARDRWHTLGPQIRNYVSDHDAGMNGDGFASDLVIAFYMIGRTRDTSLPTVVFRSSDTASRNRAREVVRRSRIMESHPGIGLGVMPGRSIQRMSSEEVEIEIEPTHQHEPKPTELSYRGPERLVSSFVSDEAIGRRLWIEGADGFSRRLATGALILRLGDQVVQITVGHAFDNADRNRLPLNTFYQAPSLETVDFDGMSDDDPDGADLQDSQFNGDREDRPSALDALRHGVQGLGEITLSLSGNTQTALDMKSKELCASSDDPGSRGRHRARANRSQRSASSNETVDSGYNLVQVGRLFDLPESNDLDYALIELDDRFRLGLNRIKTGRDSFEGWVSVTSVRDLGKENNSSVSIITWTSSKGHALGKVSATPSYLRIAGTSRLQEVFRVELDVPLAQGDCGSPIVDRVYGHFYGHIVAGVIGTREGYMVAATRVMQDIEVRHQRKAHLAPPIPITGIVRELELHDRRRGIKGTMRHLRPPLLATPALMPRYEQNSSFQTIEFASVRYFEQHQASDKGSNQFFVDLEIMSRYMNIGSAAKTRVKSKATRVKSTLPSSSDPLSSPPQFGKSQAGLDTLAQNHNTEASHSQSGQPPIPVHLQAPASNHEDSNAPPVHRYEPTGSVFQDLFFTRLPLEIQLEIMSWLGVPDILHLRLVSRTWNNLITSQDSKVASSYLRRPHIPSFLIQLIPPPPSPASANLGYIASLWHRYSTACDLASSISEWITHDQFLRRDPDKRQDFLDRELRMRRRLVPFLLFATHYLESYTREILLLLSTDEGTGDSESSSQDHHETIERRIMDQYNDMILLQVHQFFPVLLAFQGRRLRPASYLGRVERSLRGYLAEPLAEDVQVAMLYLGGLHTLERLTRMDAGYSKLRLEADHWFLDLTHPEHQDHEAAGKAKRRLQRRAILGSSSNGQPIAADQHHDGTKKHDFSNRRKQDKGKAPAVPISIEQSSLADPKWRPLGSDSNSDNTDRQLSHEQVKFLLEKLSKVMKSRIWVPTAEAVLLERGVIGRAQDIKRNAAVLQELISPEPSCMDVLFYERGLYGELDFGATV